MLNMQPRRFLLRSARLPHFLPPRGVPAWRRRKKGGFGRLFSVSSLDTVSEYDNRLLATLKVPQTQHETLAAWTKGASRLSLPNEIDRQNRSSVRKNFFALYVNDIGSQNGRKPIGTHDISPSNDSEKAFWSPNFLITRWDPIL